MNKIIKKIKSLFCKLKGIKKDNVVSINNNGYIVESVIEVPKHLTIKNDELKPFDEEKLHDIYDYFLSLNFNKCDIEDSIELKRTTYKDAADAEQYKPQELEKVVVVEYGGKVESTEIYTEVYEDISEEVIIEIIDEGGSFVEEFTYVDDSLANNHVKTKNSKNES